LAKVLNAFVSAQPCGTLPPMARRAEGRWRTGCYESENPMGGAAGVGDGYTVTGITMGLKPP